MTQKRKKSKKRALAKILIITSIVVALLLYVIALVTIEYALKRKNISSTDYYESKEATMDPTEVAELNDGWYAPGEEEMRNDVEAQVEDFLQSSNNAEVYIKAFDGIDLYARIFRSEKSSLWALVFHGYGSNHEESLDLAMNFYNHGYNVITSDMRGHSKSGGEYITLGLYDQKDVASWVDYTLSINKDARIVLHGSSMAAASVLLAAGNENLPSNVFAIVSDSSFTGVIDVLRDLMNNMLHISEYPFIYTSPLVIKMHTSIDFSQVRPIDALAHITVPIFFVHGLNDFVIPPYMVRALYDVYDGEKEILEVVGANHLSSRYVDSKSYYSIMYDFLARHE